MISQNSTHYVLLLLVLSLTLLACIDENAKKSGTPPDNSGSVAAKKMPISRVGPLYENYHQTPATQAQKDENTLIDYAMEKELDVKRTASGLYYIIEKEGKGPFYFKGEPCKVHYTGYTLDGKIFDSSHKRNEPLAFKVGQMIPGWNEALKLMNTGTKAKLLIPSHLAYGTKGFPGLIGPNEPLVFDLEIMPFLDTKPGN